MEIIITDGVSAALDQLGTQRKNKAVAEAVGLAVVALAIRSFNDPSVRAAPWSPLKPATIAQKIKEGTSTAILKRHSLLFRSWRVIESTANFVRVGSDRAVGGQSLAAIHQWGTRDGRIPARPMLPLTGTPDEAAFTPLAIRNMVEAGKAALADILGR